MVEFLVTKGKLVVRNSEPLVVIDGKEKASNTYPHELVKSKFMKINSDHIEYIIDCVCMNTTKVNNIKQYLLAAIFNAPNTIGSYFATKVNHDLYG